MANRHYCRKQRFRQIKYSKELFSDDYITGFDYTHQCILDDFPQEIETKEATRLLCSVGFASPPDWLKSYSCLSQGEKMRVDIARALCLPKKLYCLRRVHISCRPRGCKNRFLCHQQGDQASERQEIHSRNLPLRRR